VSLLLDGRIALVTGAARGMGRGVALRIAEEGGDVALLDLRAEQLQQTADLVRERGRRALVVPHDLRDVTGLPAVVDRVERELGPIDCLVNCAGVIRTQPLLGITEEDWDRVIDVNQKGLFFCLQEVARRMVPRRRGAIVNFSSVAGRSGRPLAAHYSASKFAVISITRSAALALAEHGIRVNAICPGIVLTPMWEQIDRERGALFGWEPGEAIRRFIDTVPLRRAGTEQDIASAVVWLLSDQASYITGQALNVDGGVEMD